MAAQPINQEELAGILISLEQELVDYNRTTAMPFDAASVVEMMRSYYREAYDLWQLMEDLAPADFRPSEQLALRIIKLGVNPYTKACWQSKHAANWVKLGLPAYYAPAVAVIFFYLIEQHILTPYSAEEICRDIVYGLREGETLRDAIILYTHPGWHRHLSAVAERIAEDTKHVDDLQTVIASKYL